MDKRVVISWALGTFLFLQAIQWVVGQPSVFNGFRP